MSLLDTLKSAFGGGDPLPEIQVDALAQALSADASARLIDVRSPAEFRSVRARRAENVPLDQIGSQAGSLGLPTDTPVYIICQSGGRSRRAAQILRGAGIDAVNVAGGTAAWVAAALPSSRG